MFFYIFSLERPSLERSSLGRSLRLIFDLSHFFKAGHVYLTDYKILENIPRYDVEDDKRYVTEPLGLFYVKKNGDLVPIAIQIFQQPSETNPIWTPNDSEYDWLFAKMWLRTADTQIHQVSKTF